VARRDGQRRVHRVGDQGLGEPIVLIGSDAALKTGRQKENTP